MVAARCARVGRLAGGAAPRSGVARFGVLAQHRAPAVDGHGGAVDEAGTVREQPGDGRGDLLGTPDAADWVQPPQLLFDADGRCGLLTSQERLVALGGDRAQGHGVDPDAARPVVDRQRVGQPLDSRPSDPWSLAILGR
jgi:hypothetical protein